jgi:hypothetical protein
MTTNSKVLAGSIISIFGPIAFIGDFIVGTKTSIIIGAVFLALLVLLIVYPFAINEAELSNATTVVISATSVVLVALWISGIVLNFMEYSKK